MAKPEYISGMGSNNSKYFEKGRGQGNDYDKGSNQYTGNTKLQDGYSRVAHQDAPDPVAYTQSRTARKGGGFNLGEKQYIYEKVKQKEAPAQQAAPAPAPEAAPEPEKDKGPVELSPEIAQAKERVAAYKIDGNAGSLFSTDEPQAAEAEPDAQSFADKYKLNLIEQAVPGS